VKADFTSEAMTAEYVSIYEFLLAGRGRMDT